MYLTMCNDDLDMLGWPCYLSVSFVALLLSDCLQLL